LGSPANLTDAARAKGSKAIQEKALANANNRRATGYIKQLRNMKMTYRTIAAKLNEEGFRTSRDKLFEAMSVKRLYDRV